MKIKYIEINQPIGSFYLGKANSDDLLKYFFVNRIEQNVGIQRNTSQKRIEEISLYCQDPDATFPTPIIIAVDSSKVNIDPENNTIQTTGSNKIFEVIDGQHRMEGIKLAKDRFGFSCELVVILMFDLTEEEKGYVFSTINSNQAKVDKSLIYDLFELSQKRSPLKTSHYIARSLNSDIESPFYNRLKMLGRRSQGSETLSQGSFVHGLVALISKNPQSDMISIKRGEALVEDSSLPFRSYFIENKDEVILKIMSNYFNAVKSSFPNEWESSDFILAKTTGYLGLMKAFPVFYNEGLSIGSLTEKFFEEIFRKVKSCLDEKRIILNSTHFPSGAAGQNKLRDVFVQNFKSYRNEIVEQVMKNK